MVRTDIRRSILLHHKEAGRELCEVVLQYRSHKWGNSSVPHDHQCQDFEKDLQETVFIRKERNTRKL